MTVSAAASMNSELVDALDVENEARVLDAIRAAIVESKTGGGTPLTVLMIAHRASAVRRADRVFELGDRRIARAGTWEELQVATLSEL